MAQATRTLCPSIVASQLKAVVIKAFNDVNHGDSTLALLEQGCDWLAEYVATIFVCERDNKRESWTEVPRSIRKIYLKEGKAREARGDYDWETMAAKLACEES